MVATTGTGNCTGASVEREAVLYRLKTMQAGQLDTGKCRWLKTLEVKGIPVFPTLKGVGGFC